MRILNVNLRGRPTLAVRKGRKLINLAIAAPKLPRDLKGLIELGDEGLESDLGLQLQLAGSIIAAVAHRAAFFQYVYCLLCESGLFSLTHC